METITIEDRKKIVIIGAMKVLSSTNNQAVVEVEDSTLVISGQSIEVTKLNLEEKQVIFAGEIDSVKYTKKAEKVGLLKRLFK